MVSGLGDSTQLPSDIGARIRQAQGRVKQLPRAGTLILAEENTWAAHALLVKDPHNGIEFNPTRYAAFDGILAAKLSIPGLVDKSHGDYAKHEGMRTNLAVIRNYILTHYFNTGQFNNGDDAMLPTLQSIAASLAESLTSQKQGMKAVSRSLNLDIAGIEGIGAAKIYAHIADIQDKPSLWQPLMKNVKSMFSMPERKWDLPKLEDSPFSMHGLASPPPNYLAKTLPDATPRTKPSDPDFQEKVKEALASVPAPSVSDAKVTAPQTPLDEMADISEDVLNMAKHLRSVDTLGEPTKEESVEEARKILRWLRNMEFADRDLEEFVDHGAPKTVVAKKQAIQKLIKIVSVQLQMVHRRNQEASRDTVLEAMRDAMEAMALTVAEHTRNMMLAHHAKMEKLEEMMEAMPDSALLRQNQTLNQLLDTIELGLERATGQEVSDLSAASRLQLLSQRLQQNAFELNNLDELKAPTREESFDLVQDLLNKLKSQPYSNRPIEEFIEHGTAQEKAAFAQQVVSMSDALRNIIAEASVDNPNILDDPKIKDANTAVGKFSYAVSLMAAKEIPSSAAATQQISADVARMPEEWGNLHDRTVDRIVKSAEGALEKALGDAAMEQDDMEEDMMKEAIESALQQSDQAKRKKKKRRGGESKGKSGKGYKKQKRAQMDMTADDYVLKQGRFAEDSKAARNDFNPVMPVVIPGIKAEDLEAIRQLGGNLRDIGNQLRDMARSASNTPNDRSTTQRPAEQHTPPRGPSGPRV